MSRNYSGMLPLRGLRQPIRSEAEAWHEIIRWRDSYGLPVTPDEARRAHAAMFHSPEVELAILASVAPLA